MRVCARTSLCACECACARVRERVGACSCASACVCACARVRVRYRMVKEDVTAKHERIRISVGSPVVLRAEYDSIAIRKSGVRWLLAGKMDRGELLQMQLGHWNATRLHEWSPDETEYMDRDGSRI